MSILCQMFGAYQKHHPCLRSRVASKYPLPFCQMRDGHFGYLHGHPSIVTDAPKLSRQGREQGVETSKTTHWRRKEVKFWPRWTKMYPNVVNSIVNLGDGLGLLMAFRFFLFCPAGLPHVPPASPTQTTGCETTALRPGRRVAIPQRSSAVHHGETAPNPCDLSCILGIRTSLANQIMARIGKTQGHPGFWGCLWLTYKGT